MNIIITAGGTTEKIDQVRKITNTATGRLGSLTAEAFARQGGGRIENIFYVCENGTVLPKAGPVTVVPVEGVESVRTALARIFSANRIDAVVHSMAVSDYTVDRLTTAEALSAFLAHRLSRAAPADLQDEAALAGRILRWIGENDRLIDRSKKIGSDLENLTLLMKRTPKLIGLIRKMQPAAILVGFKLLNHVEPRTLLDVGYKLLKKNSCDFVVANDSARIGGDRHVGYLICADRSYRKLETKEQIAEQIAQNVLRLSGGKAGKA